MRRLSGTQLTVIIVAAMVCLALPVTAVGAGIAKVAIAGSNGKTAKVSGGRLDVSATVSGTVSTQQQGTVTTQTAPVRDQVHSYSSGLNQASGCSQIYVPPAGRVLVIRQLRIDNYNFTANGPVVLIYQSSTCTAPPVAAVTFSGLGSVVVPLDPGYAIDDGKQIYAQVFGAGNTFTVQIDGYTLPGSALP